MSATTLGLLTWSLQRDDDGHRTYTAEWLVETNNAEDGPAIAIAAAGLPTIGSIWFFGNDVDPWAYCWPTSTVAPYGNQSERATLWKVGQTFSTKPFKRCQDTSIENPLAEPPRLSGSFIKFTKQVSRDRNGNKIASSSHELYQYEVDDNRPTVRIGLNLPTLPIISFAPMIDTVNGSPMWGLPARCVKLSNVSWGRQVYQTCSYYYTVDYEFEINYNTFDFKTWDHGTKVLRPGGNPADPRDFKVYQDANDNITTTLLDGNGNALTDGASPVEQVFEHYPESNFFLLGIPATL